MILLSIFLANIVNILSTHAITTTSEKHTKNNYLKVTDTNNHLIWFLQVWYFKFSLDNIINSQS